MKWVTYWVGRSPALPFPEDTLGMVRGWSTLQQRTAEFKGDRPFQARNYIVTEEYPALVCRWDDLPLSLWGNLGQPYLCGCIPLLSSCSRSDSEEVKE
jgi:hypothetical protein